MKYDEKLTGQLRKGHESLLSIYGNAWKDGYLESNFELLAEYLLEFKSRFQIHVLKENVKIYPYLANVMKCDENSLVLIQELREDMNNNASVVIEFCKKYEQIDRTQDLKESFKADYHVTGHAMVRRIQHQENELYTLYDTT